MSSPTALRAPAAVAGLALAMTAPLAAQSDKDGLEHCTQPIASLAVVEPSSEALYGLRRYQLESPTSLIRMMAQQSSCFVVVERGAGLQTMKGERELAASGELQQGSNVGGGQMKAADYYLTPNVLFSEGNAGGVGGAVGGLLSRKTAGAVGGGLKFKEAQTTLLLGDVRSGVQVASAQGKAKSSDISLAGIGFFGGAMAAGAGGYTHTNEGKVIAKSFLDNFNKIVVQIREDSTLKRDVSGAHGGGAAIKAGASFGEGDVLAPKIENVKLLKGPDAQAAPIATLRKGEELVYLGEEKDGFLHVQTGTAEGWVKKALVKKQ
jgi:curli biogenesis system outer membrane secretion channel CsgG